MARIHNFSNWATVTINVTDPVPEVPAIHLNPLLAYSSPPDERPRRETVELIMKTVYLFPVACVLLLASLLACSADENSDDKKLEAKAMTAEKR